jgi:hypothetical protein
MSLSNTSSEKASGELSACPAPAAGTNLIASPDRNITKEPPLPIDRLCGHCGYFLTGLSPEGNCPECGENYVADEMIIPGWAAGPHEGVTNAPPKNVWRVTILSSCCLWIQVINLLAHHRLDWALALAGSDAAFLAWLFYRRRMLLSQFGCTAHLRLSPRGFAQREGFGTVKLLPWTRDLRIELSPKHGRNYLLTGSRAGHFFLHKRTQYPISFQFECSSEQANRLKEQIAEFKKHYRSNELSSNRQL